MYGRKLTDQEVTTNMVELRNLRKLHARDRAQIHELKAENIALRTMVDAQQKTIATLQIQMAELQTMVFGKKKKPPSGTVVPLLPAPVSLPRTKASYHCQPPQITNTLSQTNWALSWAA